MANSITSWDFSNPANNATADGAINWAENQLPSTVNGSARVMMQRLGQYYHDQGGDNTVGGSADVITVTLRDGATSYINGMHWTAVITATNATTTPTMNVNAIGAKTIQKYDELGSLVALDVGDNATGVRQYVYLSGPDRIILMNPAGGGSANLWRVPLPTIANDVSDATNDISFSEGAAWDTRVSASGRTQVLCAAMIKKLDANWAEGTDQGMRYSGAAIANTGYHQWAIWKDDGTQDYYCDPSPVKSTVLAHVQAEPGGADYTHLKRLGWISRVGGVIRPFTQNGDEFLWVTASKDWDANNPGTSAVLRTLPTPNGLKVRALINVSLVVSTPVAISAYISSPDVSDQASGLNNGMHTMTVPGNSTGGVFVAGVRTDTSSQVRTRLTNSSTSITLIGFGLGYLDPRTD